MYSILRKLRRPRYGNGHVFYFRACISSSHELSGLSWITPSLQLGCISSIGIVVSQAASRPAAVICALFLSRVSTLTRDIDIAVLSIRPSVCLSIRDVPVLDENGLTYYHSFFPPYGSRIILVLSASNIFTKTLCF